MFNVLTHETPQEGLLQEGVQKYALHHYITTYGTILGSSVLNASICEWVSEFMFNMLAYEKLKEALFPAGS